MWSHRARERARERERKSEEKGRSPAEFVLWASFQVPGLQLTHMCSTMFMPAMLPRPWRPGIALVTRRAAEAFGSICVTATCLPCWSKERRWAGGGILAPTAGRENVQQVGWAQLHLHLRQAPVSGEKYTVCVSMCVKKRVPR